ncbi:MULTISPECIES: hypothetical protein [Nocardia]|uniref:hypothetical protein n=1 Tax=Nocardia TaxID=1817 RepID=UPI001359A7F1|nr:MULTISPECIES: hypothetical protein [Nocardia]MBF6209226.1 hypothetical protein [Streptomyces gardneri]
MDPAFLPVRDVFEASFAGGRNAGGAAIAFRSEPARDWLSGDRRAYDLVAATYNAL